MMFEEVLPALRAGQAIQRVSQPIQWAYLMKSPNGAFHWYGYGDDPDRAVPMSIDHTHLVADDWVVVDQAAARARKPAGTHWCGRRGGAENEKPDHYETRSGHRACSYCGSLNGDDFMSMLEAGTVRLGPTDKNYKVYVELVPTADDEALNKEKWKRIGVGQHVFETEGQEAYDKWFAEAKLQAHGGSVGSGKFYFQHLDEAQQGRFIELLNAKKLHIGMPGHFYRVPFFIQYVDPAPAG